MIFAVSCHCVSPIEFLAVNESTECEMEGRATSVDGFSQSMKDALCVMACSEGLTRVLGEADGEGTSADLLLKQVLLVEEEDDGRVCEPFVVADGVKQLHALVHAVLRGERGGCCMKH